MASNNGKVTRTSAQAAAIAQPTKEDLEAQIAALKAELAAAQAKKSGTITYKVTHPHVSGNGEMTKSDGAVSVYGLGRFPVTLYADQWDRLFADHDNFKAFCKANASEIVRR